MTGEKKLRFSTILIFIVLGIIFGLIANFTLLIGIPLIIFFGYQVGKISYTHKNSTYIIFSTLAVLVAGLLFWQYLLPRNQVQTMVEIPNWLIFTIDLYKIIILPAAYSISAFVSFRKSDY